MVASMVKTGGSSYRARVVAELDPADRAEIEAWLDEELDPDTVERVSGERLAVAICDLAGRDPQRLARQVERLTEHGSKPLLLRPGAAMEARPNRSYPRLLLLPFDAYGALLPVVAQLVGTIGGDLAPGAATARLYMTVGLSAGGDSVAGEGAVRQVPRWWPRPVPRSLRRRMDAVRLAVYPSKTTSEARELTALTQVELPRAATVR
jgi:hypothetical protein